LNWVCAAASVGDSSIAPLAVVATKRNQGVVWRIVEILSRNAARSAAFGYMGK
jgi:hypothetical protein